MLATRMKMNKISGVAQIVRLDHQASWKGSQVVRSFRMFLWPLTLLGCYMPFPNNTFSVTKLSWKNGAFTLFMTGAYVYYNVAQFSLWDYYNNVLDLVVVNPDAKVFHHKILYTFFGTQQALVLLSIPMMMFLSEHIRSHIKEWSELEKIFFYSKRDNLLTVTRTTTVVTILVLGVTVVDNYVFTFTKLPIEYWWVPFLPYDISMLTFINMIWIALGYFPLQAIRHLRSCVEEDINTGHPTVIYSELFVRLFNVIRNIEDTFSSIYAIYYFQNCYRVLMFFFAIPFWSNYAHMNVFEMAHFLFHGFYAVLILMVGPMIMSSVIDEVHSTYKYLVRTLQIKKLDSESHSQLELVLNILEICDQPSVSLGGYLEANRTLIQFVTSNIVTYLIVIIQFSLPAGPNTCTTTTRYTTQDLFTTLPTITLG